VLGFGETFYARVSGHPGGADATGVGSLFGSTPRTRTLAGGLLFPIGIDGLTLNIEGTESLTAPKVFDLVQTDSIFDRLSVRMRYPWVRTRSFNLASEFIFDAEEEKVNLTVPGAVFPLSLDRLRVLRAAIDANRQFESGGILAGRVVASAGVDAFGARSRADATLDLPLSRDGADANFQKLEALVTYAQPIAEHLGVALYARGQTSFNQALARAEQIGIASFRELSTFDAGTLGGDSGWIIRGDVSSPWTFPVGSVPVSFTPYAFAATGTLYLERPTIFEQKITRVSSFGIGLNLGTSLGPGLPEATLTLEFGRRIRDDGLPDGNRFTFVGAIQF
jgi:hemolysin activation/secretion protein